MISDNINYVLNHILPPPLVPPVQQSLSSYSYEKKRILAYKIETNKIILITFWDTRQNPKRKKY